jgi:hypothetical protein
MNDRKHSALSQATVQNVLSPLELCASDTISPQSKSFWKAAALSLRRVPSTLPFWAASKRERAVFSIAIPISLVKGIVKRHFQRKVADVVFMNLSRLASQWEQVVNASLLELEKESGGYPLHSAYPNILWFALTDLTIDS